MIKNIEKNRYGEYEGEFYSPLFNVDIKVSIPSEQKMDYAQKCVEYFCQMSNDIVDRLCRYCIRYCEEFRAILFEEDMPVPEGVDGREILDYIEPTLFIVEEKSDESVIEFHVECECEWEMEHGLEITIKDGKILYVGSFDDMAPCNLDRIAYVGYYNEDIDMNMNYADKE